MIMILKFTKQGNSVLSEKFIRTLKNKTYKHTNKNVFIDKLDKIVDKHNSKYHRTTIMKPVDCNC